MTTDLWPDRKVYETELPPKKAIALEDDSFFQPVHGEVVGKENNSMFATWRWIFVYDNVPRRQGTNTPVTYSFKKMYLNPDQVRFLEE